MTAAQTVFLIMYAVLCLGLAAICVVLYRVMKSKKIASKLAGQAEALWDEPVNDTKRADKLTPGEWSVYGSLILCAALYVFRMLPSGPMFPILGRMVLVPPLLALFNARKRTGKALFALAVALAVFLAAVFGSLLIGFPTKPPDLTLDGTPISIGRTTVQELYDSGFDLYLRGEDLSGSEDVPPEQVTAQYTKYDGESGDTLPAGTRYANTNLNRADYVLVKDAAAVGSVNLYGGAEGSTALRDCTVVAFETSKEYLTLLDSAGYSLQLDGIPLKALSGEAVEETYKRDHIYHRPAHTPGNTGGDYYGISLSGTGGGIFWPEYYIKLYLDPDESMVRSAEIDCRDVRWDS